MISLERRDGRPLRIGHRGAATLAAANTLESFRTALEVGVDLLEFDVVATPEGKLVVSHSVGEMQPDTPSLDDVLAFFADEARETGVHLDLKRLGREREIVEALRRFGLVERSFVSTVYVRSTRRLAALGGVRVGITVPRGVLGISDTGRSAPIARASLRALGFLTPRVVRSVLSLSRASAIVMHHSIVSAASVRASHACGAPVVAWTIDDRDELERAVEAGVDAVVTNDPRIFVSEPVSTMRA